MHAHMRLCVALRLRWHAWRTSSASRAGCPASSRSHAARVAAPAAAPSSSSRAIRSLSLAFCASSSAISDSTCLRSTPVADVPTRANAKCDGYFLAHIGHRRRHVYRAGIGVPVLKMTASARAFQRCVARACTVIAYAVMALYSYGQCRRVRTRNAEGTSSAGGSADAVGLPRAPPLPSIAVRARIRFFFVSEHADGERRGPSRV